jgi:hypothetical protein
MLYQIFEVITIYLDFEIVTRFEVQEIMFLPKIQIRKQPMFSNLDELMKIYPEINQELEDISRIITFDASISKEQLIFENGLKKLLLDNRLNDFQTISGTEKFFKTCHFVFNNKLINCSKVNTGVYQGNPYLMIINDLTYPGIVEKSEIEKITLSLNPFQILSVYIFLSHSNDITITTFTPEPKTRTRLTFSSFSFRKLNSIHNKCISEEELKSFGEDYFDFIVFDCYFKSLNKSYGCIPFNGAHVYFNGDTLKNGYKFCKNSNVTIDSLTKISTECVKRWKPKCNSINLTPKWKPQNFYRMKPIWNSYQRKPHALHILRLIRPISIDLFISVEEFSAYGLD